LVSFFRLDNKAAVAAAVSATKRTPVRSSTSSMNTHVASPTAHATVHKPSGAGAVSHKPAVTVSDDDFEEF
jgi:hypothetical protein